MKKIVSLSKAARKYAFQASTTFLAAFALFFAAAPCTGRMSEPEVPEKLR